MENIVKEVQERLLSMQDLGYRDFQSKLMPTVSPESIIGVRTPVLRKYAKEFAKTDEASIFLQTLPHTYYEENNLHAFVIEQIKDYEKCVEALECFLPYVDNWATCDSMKPKVMKKNLDATRKHAAIWMASEHAYTIRFGIEVLMNFFLDDAFSVDDLEAVANIQSEEYYVNMMRAWYFATALAKQYDATIPFIENQQMDVWTHNKAIQKAIESYRITSEQKVYLRGLKIKK